MKKIIYGILSLGLIGFGVVGCKKDNVFPNSLQNSKNEFNVSTDGQMLIFETIEDYERAVDGELAPEHVNILEIIDNMNFENYFSNVQLKSTDDDENGMDDFLGQLLNKDGVIQIGENIFRIDLINEKVFVLDIKSKEKDYSDLIAGNAANKNIQIFSTDDDVLDIIMNGVQEKACGGIGGGEYVTSVVSFGNNINCQGSVKHFRAGIYFRTTARFVPLINESFILS